MLLPSENSIRTELGILLSSGPSTCLNSNKLFLFSIIMMRKTAGAGKCAFEMIFFCSCRLHTTKNISPSPTLQFGGVFYIDVDQGSLINKFFVVDALIWCLSQQISVKKTFLSRTERFGSFLFCFFYSNLGLPCAKSLQNERLGSCPVSEKSSR